MRRAARQLARPAAGGVGARVGQPGSGRAGRQDGERVSFPLAVSCQAATACSDTGIGERQASSLAASLGGSAPSELDTEA